MADISASTWNPVDEANTAISPLGFADGNSPNKLAAKIRSMSGAIKRGWEEANAIYTSTGTASAYVVTFAQAAPSYVKGKYISFFPHATNTGACTLNINALGAKSLLRDDGTALAAGDILAGQSTRVYYDGSNFRVDGISADAAFPGTVTAGTVNATTLTGNGAGITNVNAAKISGIDLTGLVQTSRSVTAGNGITGGGDLTANRTITLGTPSSITSSSTNLVSPTSHTHDLVLTQADMFAYIGYTPVPNARGIIAGNGLTGGGDFTASRSITLGTPLVLNSASGNSVTATGHSHLLDLDNIASTGTSLLGAGTIGTYMFGILTSSTATWPFGSVVNGASLTTGGTQSGDNYESGNSLAGTWRCMGHIGPGRRYYAIWLRVS